MVGGQSPPTFLNRRAEAPFAPLVSMPLHYYLRPAAHLFPASEEVVS